VTIAIESNSRSVEINIIDTVLESQKTTRHYLGRIPPVSEGVNRSFEGSGLGLSISKHYADLMGERFQLKAI
jgi:signal transduction histidine kinase